MTSVTIGTATAETLSPLFEWARRRSLGTPVHLFCEGALRSAVHHLRGRLNARIAYATKANIHPRVLAVLCDLVDELNVTNPAHLDVLLAAGVEPARITYLNPVIPARTARAVRAAGVDRFVVDDQRGLDVLTSLGEDLRLTLRMLPSRAGQSQRSLVRFGNAPDRLPDLAARAVKAGARIEALSFFVGTHPDDADRTAPHCAALDDLVAVHRTLAEAGIDVPVLNIGGGFPGGRRRFHHDHPEFFERIRDHLAGTVPAGVTVVCEPGRFLAEPAMAMLASVVADRRVAERRMTYLDASAYAGLFETTFIDTGGADLAVLAEPAGPPAPTQLLGPIMDSFDVIKRDALLPPLAEGDLLLFPNTGAYSWGYAASCEGVRQPDVVPLPAELDELIAGAWFD